jgi:hypothetical protein
MTLFEFEELTRYWIDHPPPHLMIAAYLGIGKQRVRRAGAPQGPAGEASPMGADIGHLLTELGPSFAQGEVHAGMGPVVLDFSELRRRTNATRSRQQITPCL